MAEGMTQSRPAVADIEAEFALGVREMARANSFETFEAAAARVQFAADRDHAEATCLLATLEAVGAGRRQDWSRAFDLLRLAAERGSEHARAQLRLLAGEEDTEAEDWSGLRERIDAQRLLQAPVPAALSEKPRLRVFEGFASAAECRWIVERFEPRLGPATIWDEEGTIRLDSRRTNSAFVVPVTDMDVVTQVVKTRISAATRLPEFIFEFPQVMRYSVGQEFKPHYDYLDPDIANLTGELGVRGQRIGTFLVYLNDDFEGGETQFPAAGLACRGRTGDALFFANVTADGRPDPLTLHAGLAPTRGEKWILSQWIRDRPPAGAAGA